MMPTGDSRRRRHPVLIPIPLSIRSLTLSLHLPLFLSRSVAGVWPAPFSPMRPRRPQPWLAVRRPSPLSLPLSPLVWVVGLGLENPHYRVHVFSSEREGALPPFWILLPPFFCVLLAQSTDIASLISNLVPHIIARIDYTARIDDTAVHRLFDPKYVEVQFNKPRNGF